MTRSHYVFFLCVLFSLPAHSGFVTFAQWIPWSFLSRELSRHEVKVDEERALVSVDAGEWKPELQQVSLSLRGSSTGLVSNGDFLQSGSQGSLFLTIGGVRIDQVIRREFGGNVINIRVQATCSRFTASLPAFSWLTTFSLRTQDRLPVLRELDLRIPAGSWSVSPVRCEGLAGIGEEIEASLNSALKNPALMAPFIRSWLAPRLDQLLRDQWVSIADTGDWNNLHVSSVSEKGFFLRGELPLEGAEEYDLEDLPDAGEAPLFSISRQGYEALIQDRLRKLLPARYDLRENESFRKLLSSRLMQYLVWPDLRRFHPSTPFVLKTDPATLRLQLTRTADQWRASLGGNGKLVTVIGGAPIDYLFYQLSVDVPVKMELRNGDLSFTTGKASARLSWNFSPLYQLLYKPEARIPVSILTSALSGAASSRIEKVPLPRFSVGDREYAFSSLRVSDNLVTMEWP